MLRILRFFCLVFLVPLYLRAQIMPQEGSVLNYRLIGFSVPSDKRVSGYTLEIAKGNYSSEDSFKKNIIKKVVSKTNKVIAEVPSFGSPYTWRVTYSFSKSSRTITTLFHFNTGIIPEVDTSITRLKITRAALKYKDAYVFLDGNKVLYDMNGRPVWYLPLIEGKSISAIDLKISPQGTITFISTNNSKAYEVNYEGEILWKTSNDDFHHEFTRLQNGNYMTLEMSFLSFTRLADNSFLLDTVQKDANRPKLPISKLVEYNSKGNIVWQWEPSRYFEESDLVICYQTGSQSIDLHENSFYFDEKDKIVYLNYKNISRVIKIKYPEGAVINTYGERYKGDFPEKGNGLFCGEHSVRRTEDGCMLLFNNNSCHSGSPPNIEKLKEPISKNDTLRKVWEYECASEVITSIGFPSGGNVTELPDHSIFVSTAAPDSKVFIVNMDKEILWSALPERWNTSDKTWEPLTEYRASIIESKKSLERLIWNSEISEQSVIAAKDSNMPVPRSEPIVKRVSQAQ